MQDIILLQYLSKKLHTYVYKFSLNQEILFSYCGVLSFQDSYMRNLSFRNYLLNKPQKSMPCLKAIHQKIFTVLSIPTNSFMLQDQFVFRLPFI